MKNRIEALITRLAPEPICADCIAQRLELSVPEKVSQRLHELAGTRGYSLEMALCILCETTKLTIRHKGK